MSGDAAQARQVARNTLYSGLGEASNLLLFLLGFLMARVLGPTPFGQYATATAFVGLFRVLPDFGMSYASTLEIARDRGRAGRLVGHLLGFQAALSALTVLVCLGLAAWLYDGVLWMAVAVLCADLIFKSLKSTLRWLLKSFQLFGAEAVSLAVERASILVLGALCLYAGGGLVAVILVFAVVRAADTLGLAAWVHLRILRLKPGRDLALWGELLKKGLPFAYVGVMVTALFQIDQVMLEHLRGATETGWYKPPVLVLEGLTLVPRILAFAFIPSMAALHVTRPAAVTAFYRRGVKYLLAVGLPIACFGALAAEPFLTRLFGSAYAPSGAAGRILLPAAVFMFLSNFGETTLACIDRRRIIVAVSTVAVALNVILNLAWIPEFGFLGAAWATLLTEGVYCLLTAVALYRCGHVIGWQRVALGPLGAAAGFALVLWACLPLGLWAACAAASATWLALTLVLRVWDQKELETLRALLHKGSRP